MKILVTGATGLVGRAALLRLARDGHDLVAVVRSVARARDQLGDAVALLEWRDPGLTAALGACDAVVHLAGAPIVGRRWSARRKGELVASRVETTRRLRDAMRGAASRPRVFVAASATGYYGEDVRDPVDERAPAGTGFAAELCAAWEAAAEEIAALGVRVVRLRFGVVLDADGGALARLVPLARTGVGGRIGSGRQYLSWVHLDDAVEAIAWALGAPRVAGPVNVVAGAVTNAGFAAELACQVGHRALPVPAVALRLALGEAASMVLGGQHVVAGELRRHGFAWRWPELGPALADCLRPRAVPSIAGVRAGDAPPAVRAAHVLTQRIVLPAPIEEVFDFFARAGNLALLTPADLEFAIRTPAPIEMADGRVIDYQIRLGPVPMRWQTVIARWEPGRRFVDIQRRGPYATWWHEHAFTPLGDATIMHDRVFYRLPFGALGRLVHRWFVSRSLRRIFGHRARAMALRFGPAERAAAATAIEPIDAAVAAP